MKKSNKQDLYMIVLSLFDGISCGQQALKELDIPVHTYYASEIDKHAITITQNNHPNTVQLGDVNSIYWGNLPEVDLLLAGSPCFTGDTLVTTSEGYTPIKDIKVGSRVLTHKGRWKEVLQIGASVKETLLVKAQGIGYIETTANHPFLVSQRKNITTFSTPDWKKAGELSLEDYLCIPVEKSQENTYNLSEEECYILGRYIADGHRMVFSSKRLVELAANKVISSELLKLPPYLLIRLLEGILDGDGSERRGTFRLTTISENLARSMVLAVAKAYNTGCSLEFTPKTYTVSFKKESRYGVSDDYIFMPVRELIAKPGLSGVYNLEVKDDNSYVVYNAVVSNCQGFSSAGKGKGLEDERSALFFKFLFALQTLKPKHFLLENVSMKKEWLDVITSYVGVEPVKIDSNLFSAQSRVRYYWTNIPFEALPESCPISFSNIAETVVETPFGSFYPIYGHQSKTGTKCIGGLLRDGATPREAFGDKPLRVSTFRSNQRVYDSGYKYPTLVSQGGVPLVMHNDIIRRPTRVEMERLQTLPDGYTKDVSKTQARKALGNSWNVATIKHLLKPLQNKSLEQLAEDLHLYF